MPNSHLPVAKHMFVYDQSRFIGLMHSDTTYVWYITRKCRNTSFDVMHIGAFRVQKATCALQFAS